jgi:error-prone DNA polymerase
LALRVPALNRKELTLLARIGALNHVDGIGHRRDALWQVVRAGKMEGPLFTQRSETLHDDTETLPLQKMNTEERLVADYSGTVSQSANTLGGPSRICAPAQVPTPVKLRLNSITK